MKIILSFSRWAIPITIAVLCWNALSVVLQNQPRSTVLFALMAIALIAAVILVPRKAEVEVVEFNPAVATTEDIRLGSILLSAGMATEDQIKSGLLSCRCDGKKLGQALVTANCLSSEQLSRALIVQSLIRDGIMDTYVGLAKLSSSKPILANETLNATVKTIKTRSESQERMATLRRESEARLATVRKDSESRMPTMRLSDSRLATVRGSDSRLSTVRNTKESDYRFSIYRKSN